MRNRAVAALTLSGALLLGGCGAQAGTAAGPTAAATDGSSGASGAQPGSPHTFGFTATTVDGRTFRGSRLAGKPTVLWFWAPWCPTCRAESGTVDRLAGRYGGRVNVVGVGSLDDSAAIRGFADKVTGPIQLLDPKGAVWRHFSVSAQSTYVILDANGAVLTRGYLDNAALTRRVKSLAG